ncbi:MAG: NAD(P)H-binding protein [Clostridia bacterium]|nr:NAD(P)H-binding protein [Clostridia bacterium]
MRVLLIGGTGLLGSAAAAEMAARGHAVDALALPELPPGYEPPAGVTLVLADYTLLPDERLRTLLTGRDALVFAAGVDERVEAPPPVYDFYHRHNIAPLHRLLRLAREAGVRRIVVFGSYFTHFDRKWPELRLSEHHPYIRSRADQEALALSFADEATAVTVLELPYIFGAQPGRRPVWLFLVKQLRAMGRVAFYPGGGSAMVTVRQVAEAAAGALESESGPHAIPIGYGNFPWRRLLRIAYRALGRPRQPVVTIPVWLFRPALRRVARRNAARGVESGLDLPVFAQVMARRAYIDPAEGASGLGVRPDDIEAAITQSIRACVDILDRGAPAVGMPDGWTRLGSATQETSEQTFGGDGTRCG